MTVEKPKPKQLLRPITTGADSATNQSQFLEITCNTLKAREKSRVHGAIAFGFASHWLKNWRESFKPITKRSNRNYIITFDSHLKTALMRCGMRLRITLGPPSFGHLTILGSCCQREGPGLDGTKKILWLLSINTKSRGVFPWGRDCSTTLQSTQVSHSVAIRRYPSNEGLNCFVACDICHNR